MGKKCIIILILITGYISIKAQDISSFLNIVAENNPEIMAYRKLLDARKVEARTGIAPADPFVSFGFMPGTDETPGSKKTWSVNQSFSFPTRYLLQKRINKSSVALAEQEFNLGRLNTLLEAELQFFDLIYNIKISEKLKKRKEGYDRLSSAWEKMLSGGEVTIMDFNKIMFEISKVSLKISRTETAINILKENLRYMSGNKTEVPTVSDYPAIDNLDLDSLLEEKRATHPAFLLPEISYQISLQEVKLSHAESLPEFQAGYASEIIPGETFTGPVAGMSIPLWSNTNKVKTSRAMADHQAVVRDADLQRLRIQVRNEFENMQAMKKNIAELRAIEDSGNNNQQLEKALSQGEISLSTYFLYNEAAYEISDRMLELENEYNKSLARLSDHKLIR